MEVTPVPCLVEGVLDEAVVRKMLVISSLKAASFYLESLPAFRTKLRAFNQAARHRSWFALCDLDQDECAPARVRDFLPDPASGMCFRIAERAVEAWLLADRASIARFLSVSGDLVNPDPERLPAPKSHVVSLARRSRSRAVREGLVPAEGDSRKVGPEYTLLMSEYARERWNPLRAAGEVAEPAAGNGVLSKLGGSWPLVMMAPEPLRISSRMLILLRGESTLRVWF